MHPFADPLRTILPSHRLLNPKTPGRTASEADNSEKIFSRPQLCDERFGDFMLRIMGERCCDSAA